MRSILGMAALLAVLSPEAQAVQLKCTAALLNLDFHGVGKDFVYDQRTVDTSVPADLFYQFEFHQLNDPKEPKALAMVNISETADGLSADITITTLPMGAGATMSSATAVSYHPEKLRVSLAPGTEAFFGFTLSCEK